MDGNAGGMTDALTWAGTYHGIGARLLREYAEQMPIGRRANDPRRHASFLKSCSVCSADGMGLSVGTAARPAGPGTKS